MNNTIIQPNILFRGGVIIIGGDSRSDLALLARQTAVELATGEKWMGVFPVNQRRVLYLDLQPSLDAPGLTVPGQGADTGSGIVYQKPAPIMLYTTKRMNDMAGLIQQHRPEVVIIECLADTVPTIQGPKIKRVMINLRSLAKQYGICFILLHDLIKGNWKTRPVRAFDLRGDSIITYEADSIIALTGAAGKSRQLHLVKVDFSPFEITTPLLFEFNPGSATPFVPGGKTRGWVSSLH